MSDVVVEHLSITIDGRRVVDDVSFHASGGRVLAIVGASGAGKSLAVRSLLGLAPAAAQVSAERIAVGERALQHATQAQWRAVRGSEIALVTQNALGALDPLRRVRAEVSEAAEIHHTGTTTASVVDTLTEVGIPDPDMRAGQYPFELSGGLRQRAVIASAVHARPGVLVADEPTTALDATVQVRVLDLLRSIADDGTAVIIVSHDLAAVARVADDVIVMQAGRIVETGLAADVLQRPAHPYTVELLAAARHALAAPRTVSSTVVLAADQVQRSYGQRIALAPISLRLHEGEVLAVVGESGSGKSTLARLLVGAERPDGGTVHRPRGRQGAHRAQPVQLVAQHARAAFNPDWTVQRSLAEALAVAGVARGERQRAATALLADVGLGADLLGRLPGEVSGGQLQRIAIARALAASPDVLVLDEPFSALDVVVARQVLAVLQRLRAERGVAMLLISHDLGVVAEIADTVMVLRDGALVQAGPTAEVFTTPSHPFTKELLAAARMGPGEV